MFYFIMSEGPGAAKLALGKSLKLRFSQNFGKLSNLAEKNFQQDRRTCRFRATVLSEIRMCYSNIWNRKFRNKRSVLDV